MKTLVYGYEKPYIPRYKNNLAKILASRYYKKELEKPENQNKTETVVHDLLYRKFMRMNKEQLYAIYFKPVNKNNETKPSELEKNIEEIEKSQEQGLQQSLF